MRTEVAVTDERSTLDVPLAAGPGPGRRRRLLLVEDEPLLGALLSQVLTNLGFYVEWGRDAAAGRDLADSFDPDLALIDVMLGNGVTGVDLAVALHEESPWIALVLVTNLPDLRSAGLDRIPPGCGFVRKDNIGDTAVLLDVINSVLERSVVPRQDHTGAAPFANLTSSQISVLHKMAQGYSNEAIARQRGTSKSAVEQLVSGIYRALRIDEHSDLSHRAEAVRIYTQAVGPALRADPS